MKENLKKLLGIKGTILVNHLIRRNFSPMSLLSKLRPDESYSDFFFYCSSYYKNIFRAENTIALILKKNIKVLHKFVFYSKNGQKFKEINFKSSDFIVSFDLPRFKTKDKYLSFTHEIIPCDISLKIRNILGSKSLISLQHRGYTFFKKNQKSIGSCLHGNFGVINPSNLNNSAAKQRNFEFSYTPSYEFESTSLYHVLFNNPTNKSLKIIVEYNFNSQIIPNLELLIKPMGTEYFTLKKYKGQLSFCSKLPICRPIIIKNPDIHSVNFDVFHS